MSNTNKFLVTFIILVLAFVFIRSISSDETQGLLNKLNATNEVLKQSINNNVSKTKAPELEKVYIEQFPTQLSPKPKIETCSAPLLSAVTLHQKTTVGVDDASNTESVKKYYELNTNLNKQNDNFSTELNQKLFHVFRTIENSFSINLKKKVNLNLVYQSNRTDYENYLVKLQRSAGRSIGKYLYPEHISVIEIRNYEQAMQTSVHEAIHAFNQSYWGYTLRFFNEGLAEYFENMTIDGKLAAFNFSGLREQAFPMEIDVLLFSDTDWHGNTQHKLYQNSNALIHFLMSNQQGRKVIWEIMKLEKEDTCSVLPKGTIVDMLFEIYPNHQQDFDYWFQDGLALFLQNEEVK